jgi:hypothetical protein
MNDRYGALLVFRDGVTPQEAAAALERIRDVLDLPAESTKYLPEGPVVGRNPRTGGNVRVPSIPVKRPFQMIDKIQAFNPDWGWPTWYVP